MDYILLLIIGYLFMGILFGVTIFLPNLLPDKIAEKINPWLMPVASFVCAMIIYGFSKKNMLQFSNGYTIKNILVLAITVAVVVLLIVSKKEKEVLSGKEIIKNSLSGCLMEIPQRWMMQTFLYVMLLYFKSANPEVMSYVINAIIWCAAIITQAFIVKQSFDKDLYIECIASAVFSIGAGYVFISTCNLLLPMIGHISERLLSRFIQSKRSK